MNDLPVGIVRGDGGGLEALQCQFGKIGRVQGDGGDVVRVEIENMPFAEDFLRVLEIFEKLVGKRHGEDGSFVIHLGIEKGLGWRGAGRGGRNGIAEEQGFAAVVAIDGDAEGGRGEAGVVVGFAGFEEGLGDERGEVFDRQFSGGLVGAREDGTFE